MVAPATKIKPAILFILILIEFSTSSYNYPTNILQNGTIWEYVSKINVLKLFVIISSKIKLFIISLNKFLTLESLSANAFKLVKV